MEYALGEVSYICLIIKVQFNMSVDGIVIIVPKS